MLWIAGQFSTSYFWGILTGVTLSGGWVMGKWSEDDDAAALTGDAAPNDIAEY